jgi:hypothetical protein
MTKVSPQRHFIKRLQGFPGPWLGGSKRLPTSIRPVALVAPFLKVGFRAVRQEHPPRGLELDAGLVEAGRSASAARACRALNRAFTHHENCSLVGV